MIKSLLGGLCLLAVVVEMSSCVNVRKLQYMQGAFDTTKLSGYTIPEPIIQKGDMLSIMVYSDNPAASAFYNQGGTINSGSTTQAAAVAPSTATSSAGGYLVDARGDIQFQSLGNIHAEGLTKLQLTTQIDSSLKPYLANPYCTVRFLNFKITLIGDVARPGVYSIPSERVNILEAIGIAGDLNITGRRDNVLVIREQNGKREWGRIDLTRPDIFTSPFYQLGQNDLVYVDLTKNKAAGSDQTTMRNISIFATVISTLAIIYSILKK